MAPPVRLLDLTRLTARAGRLPTGVDRVERAYLSHLSARGPLWGLVRTRLGFLLLDPQGVEAAVPALTGSALPGADLLSRLSWRTNTGRARAESALRRLARARCRRGGLAGMLSKHLGQGWSAYSVGLMNLTPSTVAALAGGGRLSVMIHDTIPLDHPEFARPDAPARLRGVLTAARGASRVLCNSAATLADVQRHLPEAPPLTVARLGIDAATRGPLPRGLPPTGPYFVALGTVEGRKGLELLLDIWEDFDGSGPALVLAGAAGWRADGVLERLARGIPKVTHRADLDDGAVASLLAGAHGLLFPSRAEGFGLPPFEALAHGTPVTCAPLAIWEELLGDRAVYLDPDDRYLWTRRIETLAAGPRVPVPTGELPSWDDHFKAVLSGGW